MIDSLWRSVVTTLVALAVCGGASAESANPRPDQRVVMVTGSTSGLGYEVAKALAEEGDHVIIHGRNSESGNSLVNEIMSGGRGSARFYRADFSSLAEVHELGKAILRDYDRLDVLVNNAGFFRSDDPVRYESNDGLELHFQVNYLAGYVLTNALLPLLQQSSPSRIVMVSSIGQRPLDFDNLMLESDYTPGQAYRQSKLAQIMMTFHCADELSERHVSINALHPSGLMNTPSVLRKGLEPRSSVLTGRDAVLQLINDDVGTGKYFNVFEEDRAHEQAYDEKAVAELMEVSRKLAWQSAAH
jgi:NAD(P)-dependent dehydrogenase (short-subunit alcohol dehydrogenase family)